METDPSFNSTENQALLVVCARKTIRNVGIAALIWGAINLALGYFYIQVNILNVGVLGLALLMLGTGVVALSKPSLHALLAAAVVSTMLLFWNIGIMVLNMMATGKPGIGGGFIVPMVVAIVFFQQYLKLGHLKEAIRAMNRETVKEATGLCKQLFKSKVKESPDIAEATSKRCRMRLMNGAVFCVQRNLMRAFYINRATFQGCIPDLNRKTLRVVVRHPLGKLTYKFNKKNSAKIKGWLSTSPASVS